MIIMIKGINNNHKKGELYVYAENEDFIDLNAFIYDFICLFVNLFMY